MNIIGVVIAVILAAGFVWCWTDYRPEGLGVGDWIVATVRAVGALLGMVVIVGLFVFMFFCFTGHPL